MPLKKMDGVSLTGGPALHLTIELGFGRDNVRMSRALSAFWNSRRVVGPWLDSGLVTKITQGEFSTVSDLTDKTQFGALRIKSATPPLPFALLQTNEKGEQTSVDGRLVPYKQGPKPENSAWLTVNLPAYELAKQFHVDDTWTLRSQPWLELLCDAFVEIVDAVHAQVPIASAAIGEEALACFRRPTANRLVHANQAYPPSAVVSVDIIENRGGLFVDGTLWRELRPGVDAVLLPSDLYYVKPQLDARLLGA